MSKQRITAVVYNKRGHIIGVGENSYSQSHPYMAKLAAQAGCPEKIYLHAEIAALIKCREKPYRIRIERKNRKGDLRLAKPCAVCELAIKEAGIKFVEYSVG